MSVPHLVAARAVGGTALACLLGATLFGCGGERLPLGDSPMPLVTPTPRLPYSATANWPGFRGVNGTGVSDASNLPVTWDDRIGVRWTGVVPGSGNSSPIVWQDRVLLTTAGEARECLLLCYDRADGALLWQTEVGIAVGRRHAKNGDASSTPVTDGQHVYAFFGGAGLVCCDMQGNLLWKQSLDDLDHPWGSAASPILFDGLVIQLCDGEQHSSLVALDRRTGDVVWRTMRASTGCWSTPVVMQYGTVVEETHSIVVNGTGCSIGEQGFVIGYDPRDGAEQWRVQGTTDAGIPTPLVVGDRVVVASGRNGDTMLLRPTTVSQPTGEHAHERSNATCEVEWARANSGPYVPTGVVYQGLLYQVSDQGVLACYDVNTGDKIYRQRLSGNFTAGLIAGDGKVYATNEQGRTFVIKAGRDGTLLDENDLHAQVLATSAVADGDLFIRTDCHLYCIPTQMPEPASVNEAAPYAANANAE